jgi:sugar lactone lactonase YvrE
MNSGAGGFTSGEGLYCWTTTTNLPAYTVVKIGTDGDGQTPSVGTYVDSASSGIPTGLSSDGDQLIAFEGSVDYPYFVGAMNLKNAWLTSGSADKNNSYLPPGLTDGSTACAWLNVNTGYYDCSKGYSGTPATLRALILNSNNWIASGGNLPSTFACDFNATVIPTTTSTYTLSPTATITPTNTWDNNTPSPTLTATMTSTSTPVPHFTPSFVQQWFLSSPGNMAVYGTTLYAVVGDNTIQTFNVNDLSTPLSTWTSYDVSNFNYLTGVAICPASGNVFVMDEGMEKVYQFTSTGVTVNSSSYSFSDIYGIAADSKGNLYVADSADGKVLKFDSNQGEPITAWSKVGTISLQLPNGLALDSSDNLFVADNSYIYELDATNYVLLNKWQNNNASYTYQLALDETGWVYAAVYDSPSRVAEFAPGGTTAALTWAGSQGGGTAFTGANGIAFLPNGNILVADYDGDLLEEYHP